MKLKIHREYKSSTCAGVLTAWCKPDAGLRKHVRALEIHAYNSMTNNSLRSRCTVHPHVPSRALRLFPTDRLLQPTSSPPLHYPPLPSPPLPALTGLTNTLLEPTALWDQTNTWHDEGLMEPDVKGETRQTIASKIPSPAPESSKA